jgi:hypothetical protein
MDIRFVVYWDCVDPSAAQAGWRWPMRFIVLRSVPERAPFQKKSFSML